MTTVCIDLNTCNVLLVPTTYLSVPSDSKTCDHGYGKRLLYCSSDGLKFWKVLALSAVSCANDLVMEAENTQLTTSVLQGSLKGPVLEGPDWLQSHLWAVVTDIR